MGEKEKFWKHFGKWQWGLLILLIVLAVIRGYAANPPFQMLFSGNVITLDHQWDVHWEGKDGRYEFVIPEDMEGSLSLVMKTYMREIHLLLDEEEFYSFFDIYGMEGGSRFVIELPKDAGGKTLVLKTRAADRYSEQRVDLNSYLGTDEAVTMRLFWDNLYALIFGFGSLFMGIGLLCIAGFRGDSSTGDVNGSLIYLSGFILVTGTWVVTDSGLLLLFTNQVGLVNMLSFVSFMIMPIFLLQFMSCMLDRRPVFHILSGLFLMITAAYLINYLVRFVPGYLFLIPDHLLCLCSIGLALVLGYKSMREQESSEIKKIFAGFVALSIFVFISLAVFYTNPTYGYPQFYCVGIFLFYIFLIYAAFDRLYSEIQKNANLAVYEKLAYMDTMTGMANRTAFSEMQEKSNAAAGRTYIVMDINDLKMINDQYGHQEGDALIIAAARCIKEVFGRLGTCYRIGGDEFVVILEKSAEGEIEEKLDELKQKLEKINETRVVPLTIAAGYAAWQNAADTPGELFKKADADMYEKKQEMKADAIQKIVANLPRT